MRFIPLWLILLLCGCLVPDPVPVIPDDGQKPAPVVPSVEGPLKVLILYEADTAEFQKLPPSQILAIQSLKLRNFLQAKGADWRIWDQHVNTASEPKFWQDAIKMPANLSGGMIKRVALARALAAQRADHPQPAGVARRDLF